MLAPGVLTEAGSLKSVQGSPPGSLFRSSLSLGDEDEQPFRVAIEARQAIAATRPEGPYLREMSDDMVTFRASGESARNREVLSGWLA
jgi:hypothetical protein